MKKLIFTFLCLMVSVLANAQYKVASVDKQDSQNFKLHQVLETGNSVLIFGTYTSFSNEQQRRCIDRTARVEKNNSGYKIINAVNLPLSDEAEPRYAEVNTKDAKYNFVLEFEKFDLNGTFDLVENDSKHTESMLNFYGIHLEKINPSEAIDTDKFLSKAPVIYGNYIQDGVYHGYFIRNGMMLMYHQTWNGKKDFILNLEINNNSDHGVMLELGKVGIVGTDKDGKRIEVARFTPDSYDQYVEDARYYAARQQTGGDLSSSVESLLFRERIHTDNEWGKLGLKALEGMTRQAQDNRIHKYLQEHPNTSPRALRSNSIKAGESVRGFIPFEVKKKVKNLKINIYMDDYNFLIEYNVNH
ncbi:MAG: hypothetical protein MJZ69_09830 [Bacteroidaceae bacterium]|nr:hypothetical protein [Bacteroidaceae bacterium]